MRPRDVQRIGDDLAILWEDGSESYIRLEALRRACPCAGCRGEMDVLGRVHGGGATCSSPGAFQLRRIDRVGSYAIQPVWADGHNAGLYTFDSLKRLADSQSGPAHLNPPTGAVGP
jgi:DUF971 family protein